MVEVGTARQAHFVEQFPKRIRLPQGIKRNGDLEVYRQRVTVQDSRSAPVVAHEFK
jgi:hypothetical protein